MTHKWCMVVQSDASWSTEVLDGVPIASSKTGVEGIRIGGAENREAAPLTKSTSEAIQGAPLEVPNPSRSRDKAIKVFFLTARRKIE